MVEGALKGALLTQSRSFWKRWRVVALSRVRLADLRGWGGGRGSDRRAGGCLFTSPATPIHSLGLGNRKTQSQVLRAVTGLAGLSTTLPPTKQPP